MPSGISVRVNEDEAQLFRRAASHLCWRNSRLNDWRTNSMGTQCGNTKETRKMEPWIRKRQRIISQELGSEMYRVVFTKHFEKKFEKLHKHVQRLIKAWLENNLIDCDNPRAHGKAWTANHTGYWRYRIADYRLIAEIQDNQLIVFAIALSQRRDVSKNQFWAFLWQKP